MTVIIMADVLHWNHSSIFNASSYRINLKSICSESVNSWNIAQEQQNPYGCVWILEALIIKMKSYLD